LEAVVVGEHVVEPGAGEAGDDDADRDGKA
jgi:hypothetical protein